MSETVEEVAREFCRTGGIGDRGDWRQRFLDAFAATYIPDGQPHADVHPIQSGVDEVVREIALLELANDNCRHDNCDPCVQNQRVIDGMRFALERIAGVTP